jgi:NAD(P)H-dependent flavin oxidoreductase YrpB (nitropropane dioxygenase family)
MFKGINSISYRGREVLPLVEGGKGVSATNHLSSGAWAAAGGIGTVSAVNADSYDPEGKIIPQIYSALTRRDRHEELINYAIDGATEQVRRAYEVSNGRGAININVLWEMGGAQRILHGVLERTRGMVAGVTCGAGMPYKLSEIAASYGVSYLPIISSARAFSALWKRAYSKFADYLSAVVYEDPWLAGGHNGLSNAEDPLKPQDPYPRVKALRDSMRQGGISDDVPIVMAGGVWNLKEWNDWIDNPELGQIVFQFGTRPLLTQESPIPADWKARLMTLEEGDVLLHRFSPTGFYSSAVRNPFLRSWRRVRIGRLPLPRNCSATIVSNSMSASEPRRITGSLAATCSTPANGMRKAIPRRSRRRTRRSSSSRRKRRPSSARTRPTAWAASANAPSRPGPITRRTRPGALPIRVPSASRRRCRTSRMAAPSRRISCSPATRRSASRRIPSTRTGSCRP